MQLCVLAAVYFFEGVIDVKRLNELLDGFDYKVEKGLEIRDSNPEVSALVMDSRKVCEGCIFVCIKGMNFDGHDVAADVVSKGARILVTSRDVEVESEDVCIIRVADTRYALAFLSAAWFDHPAKKLTTIGVTGTKGKTTTTYLVKSILEHAGKKVGLIGTIESIIGDEIIPSVNTTPESYTLQETFAKMVAKGLDTVVMEVSSQGLMLHRTQGFIFDYGIFTNIEPDHIGPGEHSDFDDYMHCKGLLFKQCKVGIANGDDPHTKDVIKNHTCSLITYGFNDGSDLKASDVKLVTGAGILGVDFNVSGILDMQAHINMPGRFSVYNALCAIAICQNFNVDKEVIQAALNASSVKGRIELVKVSDDFSLMIDYAHNAMALESLLTTLKEYNPGRLVCMFGCGGNRSKLRRYDMGEVSGRLADLTVITSDNPRNEEPLDIIADIKIGIAKTSGEYVEICDRKEAIRYCIENGRKGDVIVLAGKGHEDYQEIKGVKYHMDERELIAQVLEEIENDKK